MISTESRQKKVLDGLGSTFEVALPNPSEMSHGAKNISQRLIFSELET
jgi:hypothetical protein